MKSEYLPIVLPETMRSPIIRRPTLSPQSQTLCLVCKFFYGRVELLPVDVVQFCFVFHGKEKYVFLTQSEVRLQIQAELLLVLGVRVR